MPSETPLFGRVHGTHATTLPELISRRLALMLDGLEIADRTALALVIGIEGVKVSLGLVAGQGVAPRKIRLTARPSVSTERSPAVPAKIISRPGQRPST